ncbi:MAG: polysaccharide deacetylase family protein [Colwellia sp.]
MIIRRWVKYLIALVLHYSGYNGFYIRTRRLNYILMLHRIEDHSDNLRITTPADYLSKAIEWSGEYGILASVSELVDAKNPCVRFVFTFDDGYESVKKIHDIGQDFPVIVYLSTAFIDKKREFWATGLECMLGEVSTGTLDLRSYNLGIYSLDSDTDRYEAMLSLNTEMKKFHPTDIESIMSFIHFSLNVPKPESNLFLDWESVKELDEKGIEMGGHTHNHAITSKISAVEFEHEIHTSNQLIMDCLNKSVPHFAYPNGRKQDIAYFSRKILRRHGYKSAVTTIEGPNSIGCDPFMLKRFNLSKERIETPWRSPSKAMYTSMLVNPLKLH